MYRKTVLDNGLKIISETIEYARSVSIGIWVNAGSRDEKISENGVSHFIEHMSFKGTKNRSAFQIAKELDAIGGMSNAFTGRENTCFHARVLGKHFSIVADILSDIFLNSLFDPNEIEKERSVILQEIKMMEDSPEEYVHDLLQRTFWKGHAISRPVLGTKDSIMRINRDVIFNYIKRHYLPKNVIISAAGAISHDDMLNYFAPIFEKIIPADVDPVRNPPKPNIDISINYRDLEQVHICLGVEGVSVRDEKRFIVSLLNTILGGNMSSKLFQEIREKRGLAYSVYSFLSAYMDTGILGIYAACEPNNINNVLDIINKEVNKLISGDISQDDISGAKDYMIGGIYLSSESIENRMIRMARNEFIFKRYISYDEVVSKIEMITLDDIVEMANRIFKGKTLTMVALGPLKESDVDIDILKF